jgi:hypothetical protein
MNDADQDRLILDSVDRFLERHVRPFAMKLEHDDIYPTEIVERMKEMGLFGAVIPTDYGGLGLSAATYAKIIERISAVWMSVSGIVNSHLIMARIVDRMGTPAQRARRESRQERMLLRGRAHAVHDPSHDQMRVDDAGHRHPYRGKARGRQLHRQRHQDLDIQRDRGRLLRAAGEDRSRSRAAPQGHEHAARREGAGVSCRPQAGKARLQGHRQRRTGVRGLPRPSRSADRRRRGPRHDVRDRRTGARPRRQRWTRRCATASSATPSESRSTSIRPSH